MTPTGIEAMAQFEVLHPQDHAYLRFSAPQDYAFAAQLAWVEVLHHEWPQLALQHPIVFAKPASGGIQAMAVLATREAPSGAPTHHAWVDEQGRWLGASMPGVLKLHPFALTQGPGPDTAVCVDRQSPCWSASDGVPLFTRDGVPSGALREVMQVLRRWNQQADATQVLLRSLDKLGLLRPVQLDAGHAQWAHAWQVDAQKLEELSKATVLLLRRQGWLKPIYAHLLSLSWFQGRAPQLDPTGPDLGVD